MFYSVSYLLRKSVIKFHHVSRSARCATHTAATKARVSLARKKFTTSIPANVVVEDIWTKHNKGFTWSAIQKYYAGMHVATLKADMRVFTEKNLATTVMMLLAEGEDASYVSLADYVFENEMHAQLATPLGNLCRSMYINVISQMEPLPPDREDTIIKVFSEIDTRLLQKKDVVAIMALKALAATREWERAFHIFTEYNVDDITLSSVIMRAALKHNNRAVVAEMFKVVSEIHERNKRWAVLDVYSKPMDVLVNNFLLSGIAEKVSDIGQLTLDLLSRLKFVPLVRTVTELIPTVSREYNATYTDVTRKWCNNCSEQLEDIPALTAKEYVAFKEEYTKAITEKRQVHLSTTPSELKYFFQFVQNRTKYKPFNIVIDGLNLLYTWGKKKTPFAPVESSQEEQVKRFADVLMDLSKQKFRMLVISRYHTKNLIGPIAAKIPGITMYYTMDNTDDDRFLIYAALESGMDCYVMSRDALRPYSSLINRHRFARWQRWRQVLLKPDLVNLKTKLLWPETCEWRTQRTEHGHWHVPFWAVEELMRDGVSNPILRPDGWLCLSPRQENTRTEERKVRRSK